MFIVLLRFSENRSQVGKFMEGHNLWLKEGFEDGVFLVAGSLQPDQGGGILAHNTSVEALRDRVNNDPFVANNVVSAEIMEITPAKTAERMNFLMGN